MGSLWDVVPIVKRRIVAVKTRKRHYGKDVVEDDHHQGDWHGLPQDNNVDFVSLYVL